MIARLPAAKTALPVMRGKAGRHYIGILCPYALFLVFSIGNCATEEELQQSFKFIEQDMLTVVQLLSMYSLNVTAVYIGGGTPTSLSETAFASAHHADGAAFAFCLGCASLQWKQDGLIVSVPKS